jgi:hypothetical protein
LGEAVVLRHDDIVSFLLDHGASVHGYDKWCRSVLGELAINAQDALFVRVFSSMSHAGDMDIYDQNMALRFATAASPVSLIRLVADGESLTAPDIYGQSTLLRSLSWGTATASIFAYILNSGLDLRESTPAFGSAFNYPWSDYECNKLQLLLKRLGRQTSTSLLNNKPQYRHTPLYFAAAMDQCRILRLLLTYEVDLDMVGGPMGSALMAAATYGRLEAAQVLVEAGAAISYVSVDDGTTKSAFVQAKHFPRIQRYLLVDRFSRTKCLAWRPTEE